MLPFDQMKFKQQMDKIEAENRKNEGRVGYGPPSSDYSRGRRESYDQRGRQTDNDQRRGRR